MMLEEYKRPVTRAKRVRAPTNLVYVVIAVFSVGVLVTLVNIYEMRRMAESRGGQPIVEGVSGKAVAVGRQPVVWVTGKKLTSGYLKHVYRVFERLGYEVRLGTSAADWDVLWAHDYPFSKLANKLHNLRPHQKVNHFPGSGFITMKVSLATSKIPFIPKAFKMPADRDQLLAYVKSHPDKMWVQKSNNHRGIQIKTMSELDLSADNTFVQEYVDKPFLIDGRKFDIGIYAVMTSANPLRVYIVEGDALFRFCPVNYSPFDPENVDKYVVGDDYTPMWKMPSLSKLYDERKFTFTEAFNAYLRINGMDDKKLWRDLKSCIRQVYLEKEKPIVDAINRKYKSSRWFFEMVRFDFVLDEDLNVYLMEVNMSPNLSTGHFSQNRRLYEHVIYNMLGLVGAAKTTVNHFSQSSDEEAEMMVSDSDIQTFPEQCADKPCDECAPACSLCAHCLSERDRRSLKEAYLEHINRGSCGRVFPVTMAQEEAVDWEKSPLAGDMATLTPKNRLMTRWFIGKCQLDRKWCT